MINRNKAKAGFDDDAGAGSVAAPRDVIADRADLSNEDQVSFEVGIGSFPYLVDHGFQDMIVLPGSFYIELALCVHIESLHASVGSIKRIEFRHPVILSERNVTLSVGVGWLNDQTIQYVFREASGPSSGSAVGLPCAILEIECDCRSPANASATVLSVEAFQQRAVNDCDQAGFYGRLRKNGNQYGPCFQNLCHLWRCDNEALGRLRVSPNASGARRHHLHPVLMDGVTQLLATFFLDKGRTFILQGVENIIVLDSDFPDEVWVHARLRSEDSATVSGWVGDLDVFDDSGACRLKLQGVRFTYLDRLESRESAGTSKTRIVIASTFTAEPVEDSLQFWGDYLGFPVQVSFAPYNQVFQELLSPDSQLRRNHDGFNVVLLNLGDWIADGLSVDLKVDPERVAACFGDLGRHTLPNGLEVAHLNRHETEYVYKEIFEDRCYLRHGIRLSDDATVIDIGANIGLFSLFVRNHCPHASVYAFEPSPVAFRALKANCEAYGPHLYPFNLGVSDRRGSAPLTFYEKSSVFSSFYASADEDRQAIQAVVANMVRGELRGTAESVDEYVEELMRNRLNQQTFECPLMSVSDIIRENDLQRVDLLKVDAEKCELEILRGIDDDLWRLIDQVVVEVHDRSRRAVGEIQDILAKRGFRCAVEEENLLAGSGLFNVYATRHEGGSRNEVERNSTEPPMVDLQGKVDQFVQALDSFARSANAPTVLCLCPSGRKNSRGAALDQELAASENDLIRRVREFPNVEVIGSEAILALYPTTEFHDSHSNELGHVPYTPEGFAAIGSSLFRRFIGLQRMPYKVIVLDCDNTLWQGACGEEGPLGVAVTPAHRALHEFMIRQEAAGLLLCLCSKNSEADVWAVFQQHPGMALKREHLAAWRINWAPKSDNLRSLARELNLGLESIIFLDDNPVECAEVHAKCPEVLALQLPSDPDNLPRFLDHTWAFDHLRITEEDRTRTQRVLENVQRERYRRQVSTLKDFIDGLQLQVALFEPTRDQISRVSQLTLRTNQFNFTTIRRSESDVIRYLEKVTGHCLAAKVSDRFGDYGMVGLLFYHVNGDRYDVDTFLLSCRVLGRGVEHQILAKFGRLALDRGKQWIDFPFRPTDKNHPAWDFIKSVGSEFMRKVNDGMAFLFPAEKLAGLRYDPDLPLGGRKRAEENGSAGAGSTPGSVVAVAGLSEKFQRIAEDLNGVKEICTAIEAYRVRAAGGSGTSAGGELPPTLAGRMLGIWRKAIGNPRIGMNDNFADVGGTSLKAVQIVAAIRRELHLHLSIVNIFECPTVRLLCEKLELGKAAGGSASDAMERGARRKQRVRRRA
jgi:FkbH-like protein/FkbM family methyltransferase